MATINKIIERTCGDCQACCMALGVPNIDNKPEWQVCSQQFSGGCRKYNERPQECRVFTCSWIEGAGEENERPDLLGAIFSANYSESLGYWITVHILNDEAKKHPQVRANIFKQMKKNVVIEVTKDNGHKILGGPEKQVKLFAEQWEGLIPVSALVRKVG